MRCDAVAEWNVGWIECAPLDAKLAVGFKLQFTQDRRSYQEAGVCGVSIGDVEEKRKSVCGVEETKG